MLSAFRTWPRCTYDPEAGRRRTRQMRLGHRGRELTVAVQKEGGMDEGRKQGPDELDERNELAVIQRAAAGNHAAFRLLVVGYESRLLAYLTHMLGDAEAARDVAQETFLAAYRALPRWRPLERQPGGRPDFPAGSAEGDGLSLLSPWLYRIATNRALSLLRSRPLMSHSTEAAPHEPAHAQHDVLEERVAARELLRAALRQLTEEDAACLVLHFVAGERYGEIGERLGLSSEAVRKRVSRALDALRVAYRALDVEVLA
jgi:RNA polymerase sigma-70 factor, ECF subfamily